MSDEKKIAVLVRDRKSEALRVSGGLTMADDVVDVYILDEKLEIDDEINTHLDTLELVESEIFSNTKENECDYIDTQDLAAKLLEYDVVIPY